MMENLEPIVRYCVQGALAFHLLIFGVWLFYFIKSFAEKNNSIDNVMKEAIRN